MMLFQKNIKCVHKYQTILISLLILGSVISNNIHAAKPIVDPEKFKPLEGKNTIKDIALIKVNTDHAELKVDYFFNGGLNVKTYLRMVIMRQGKAVYDTFSKLPAISTGDHSMVVRIDRPLPISKEFQTDEIQMLMTDVKGLNFTQKKIGLKILWPETKQELLGFEVESLKLMKKDRQHVELSLNYFYNKKYYKDIYLDISVQRRDGVETGLLNTHRYDVVEGKHNIKVRVKRGKLPRETTVTDFIKIVMFTFDDVLIEEKIPFKIVWPSATYFGPRVTDVTKDNINEKYKEVVSLIDKGDKHSLRDAKKILDGIILVDDTFIDAYPELARYHMKMNWSEDGRKEAEKILDLALAHNSEHANSIILQGYVYTYQNRYSEAEKLFVLANKLATNNLWLYTNWGELYNKQGNTDGAIKKWKESINNKRQFNTYDRAQLAAYDYLLDTYGNKQMYSEMDNTYQKLLENYPDFPCRRADYAHFLLITAQDYKSAKSHLIKSMDEGCEQQKGTKLILAVTHYLEWSIRINEKEASRILNKARLIYAEDPFLYEYLARNNKLNHVLKNLMKNGSNIDEIRENGITALTLAMRYTDLTTLKYLIKLGADVNLKLNENGLTPLMMAIISNNKEAVKVLIKSGADTNAKMKNGISVSDLAERFGMKSIITSSPKGI